MELKGRQYSEWIDVRFEYETFFADGKFYIIFG